MCRLRSNSRRFLMRFGAAAGAAICLVMLAGCGDSALPVGEGSVMVEKETAAFRHTIENHLDQTKSPFIYLSWFPHPDEEEFASVTPDGSRASGYIRKGIAAERKMFTMPVSDADLVEIRNLLARVPVSGQTIPQQAALIVTYSETAGTHTRVYSRLALPPEIQRLWDICSGPNMSMTTQPTRWDLSD